MWFPLALCAPSLAGLQATASWPVTGQLFPVLPHCDHFKWLFPGARHAAAHSLGLAPRMHTHQRYSKCRAGAPPLGIETCRRNPLSEPAQFFPGCSREAIPEPNFDALFSLPRPLGSS